MPAIMINATIANAGTLPVATFVDISQIREWETACTDHWIFDRGSTAGLVGLKAGTSLTQVGPTAATYTAKSVILPAAVGNQLSTGVADQLTYTLCTVVKVPPINTDTLILGSTGQSPATGGFSVGIQMGTGADVFTRAVIAGAVAGNIWNTPDFVVGSFQFFAQVIDHAGSNRLRRLSTGVLNLDISDTGPFTPHPTNRIALGATASDFRNGLEFYEAILFAGTALTQAQINAVYQRSKARLLRRSGITLT